MILEQIKPQLKRKASQMIVGGRKPSADAAASWFGRVRLARVDESWPIQGGKPMIPLCQLNLTEAPYVPPTLQDIVLLTVFIATPQLPIDTANGEGWELRAYSSLENLTEIVAPKYDSAIQPFPISWQLIEEDYASWEDVAIPLPEEIEEDYNDLFKVADCSKIGGWPNLIQGELEWAPFNRHPANPTYTFQIQSEAKAHWMWGDTGIGYFGRGTGQAKDVWTLTWQCY